MTALRWSLLYLRSPEGGVENVEEMGRAGYSLLALNVGDYPPEAWRKVEEKAGPAGLVCLPWARCRSDGDVRRLVALALDRYQGRAILDVEKELDTGKVSWQAVEDACRALAEAAVTTEPWLYEGFPWERLQATVQLQLFPQENEVSRRPRDCRAHAYLLGCHWVQPMLGMHGLGPEAFSLEPPLAVYAADDIGAGNYGRWAVRSPQPIEETRFPYRGPLYGPSHPRGPSPRSPYVLALKRALHRAGFGNFPAPDERFNRPLEAALRRMQLYHGIRPTGQYGLGSWQALRRLQAADPGQGYALDEQALSLAVAS